LGDFAAGARRARCHEIFARSNGTKRLIRGNHDTSRVLACPAPRCPVESARIRVQASSAAEVGLYLAHYAHRSWPGLWRDVRHLYGHTHATLPDTRRSCDVGVDAWHYRPVPLDAIIARQDGATEWPEELARAPRQAGSLN
jgi:calcineurin-like phosphoesterase family protein